MTKGGKKDRKKDNKNESQKRELIYKEEYQEYAQVIKHLGDCRCECQILGSDQIVRGDIRGKLKGRVFIYPNDVVLISRRSFSEEVVDIIHKYFQGEVEKLIVLGEIAKQTSNSDTDDTGFSFEGL